MNVLLLLVFCIYSGFAIMAVEMTIFRQCRLCMYRGSVRVCSSTIGVHTRTDLPYRFSRRRVKKTSPQLPFRDDHTIIIVHSSIFNTLFRKIVVNKIVKLVAIVCDFGHWLHWYQETDGSIPIQSASICADKNHLLYYFIL